MNALEFHLPSEMDDSLRKLPMCAVDLGFSATSSSCGFATAAKGCDVVHSDKLPFGTLVTNLTQWLKKQAECVLILEAPLSQHFSRFGNPAQRPFERGGSYSSELPFVKSKYCPWYSGPGASMSLAALALLQSLSGVKVHAQIKLHLFEGFHPRWLTKPRAKSLGENEITESLMPENLAAWEEWDHDEVSERLIQGLQSEPPRVIGSPPPFATYRTPLQMAGVTINPGDEGKSPTIVFASETLYAAFTPSDR